MAENNGIRGINIEIGGSSQGLQDALKDVNKAVGVTARELREVENGLRFNPQSTELLAQRQELLARQIENTTTRLNTLRQAQEQVNAQFERGEISPEQFRSFNREIERTAGILDGLNNRRIEIEADSQGVGRLNNAIEQIGPGAEKAGNLASTAFKGVATAATVAGAAVGTALGAIGASQEAARDVAILNTQLSQVGLSLDDVSASTARFAAVGQETDQISEAFGNLVQAGYTTVEQIDDISQNIAGAIVAYGDTFTSEGLAESITSTTQLGEATGQFLDLLEKQGINVDSFNTRLQSTSDVGERANIISQALADEGLAKLYEAYATGNPELVAQAQASQQLEQNWTELISTLTPLLTGVTEFANALLEVANGEKTVEEALDGLSSVLDDLLPKFTEVGGEVVANLLEGLEELAPDLIESIQETMLNLYDTILDNAPQFLDAGIDIVTNILEGFSEFLPQAAEKAVELLESIISTIIDRLPDILETGVEIVENLLEGISNVLPQLVTAATELVIQLAATIIKNLPTIIEAGVEILQALIEGIVLTIGRLGNAIVTQVIPSIFKAFLGEDWASIGRDIINGIAKGITNFGKKAVDAITGVVNGVVNKAKSLLDINSPSKVFEQIGAWTGEGMAKGIRGELKNVEGASGELAQTLIDTVEDNLKEIEKIEKEQATKLAQIETEATRKVNEINLKAKESKKKLTAAQNRQIAKIEEDAAKKALETETKYGEQISKKKAEVENAKLKAVQNFIKQQRDLNNLSIVEEANLLQQSLAAFTENSEAKIEAQILYQQSLKKVFDEITKVNEDYSSKIEKVNADLIKEEAKLTKNYEDELNKRTDAIANVRGIFEEFSVTVDVTGRELLDNLQSQVDGLKKWEEEFTKLSERAIDDGLLAELRRLGPEALGELQALNSLSDKELTQYSNLYQEKTKVARESAIKELRPLEQETKQAIEKLRSTASGQLDILNAEWAAKIQGLTTSTQQVAYSMESIGRDIINGLIGGLSSGEGALNSKIEEISSNIEEITRKTLKTRSPSRVMIAIGQDIVNGLIVGLEEREGALSTESKRLAENIINSIQSGKNVSIADLLKIDADEESRGLLAFYNRILDTEKLIEAFDPAKYAEQANEKRLAVEEKYSDVFVKLQEETERRLEQARQYGANDPFTEANINYEVRSQFYDQIKEYQDELEKVNESERINTESYNSLLRSKVDDTKEFIRRAKSLNKLNLSDEARLYGELASLYSSDSEEFKYFTEEKNKAQKTFVDSVTKINQEYTSKIKKANDDLVASTDELENKYNATFNSIRDGILNATSGFGEFQRQDKIQGRTLIKNLESQIRAINEYNSVINSLGGRVDDEGFVQYLQSLGPDSLSELEALNSLSREELNNYVDLYNERFEKASNSASIQLEGLREDTDKQILALQQETASQLEVYQQEWANAIANITGNVQNEFSELPKTMEETGRDIISSISKGLSDTLPSLQAQLQRIANTISDSISSALDTQKFYADIQSSSQRLANATNSAFGSLSSSVGKSTAQQTSVQNIVNQQASDNKDLISAVNNLASRAIETYVTLDGRILAQAVSTHQYQNASINALTKGVQIY